MEGGCKLFEGEGIACGSVVYYTNYDCRIQRYQCKTNKIRCTRLRRRVAVEPEHHAAQLLLAGLDVEEDLVRDRQVRRDVLGLHKELDAVALVAHQQRQHHRALALHRVDGPLALVLRNDGLGCHLFTNTVLITSVYHPEEASSYSW